MAASSTPETPGRKTRCAGGQECLRRRTSDADCAPLQPGKGLFFLSNCGAGGNLPRMTSNNILWVYIALLLVGGLIGYLKAKSPVSLVMSAIFAALLIPCAMGIVFKSYMALIFLGALLIVFAMRLAKTKKFMPAGFMLTTTIIMFVVRLTLH
jgi:uncharacterized membrane protein (UPF0136 family)